MKHREKITIKKELENMRNPDRIAPFLEEIGILWKEKCTDWRFGQLMYNFFSVLGDPFYYEEDEFLEAFQAYCNREDPKEAVKKYREQKVDTEAVAKYQEELSNFFKQFNTAEFQMKLKKEVDEINAMGEVDAEDDLK